MSLDETPVHIGAIQLAVFCAEPIKGGTALCPELLGSCPAHPVCGELEPLTQSARCRNRQCDGTHQSGRDGWTEPNGETR